MKSIMEEASSVAKAIEKGWIRAGKPQEFTVKVFEEAQKNFIGMTTKSAKIALFFEEKLTQPHQQRSQQTPRAAQQQQPKKLSPHAAPSSRSQQPQAARQPLARPEKLRRELPSDGTQSSQTPWNQDLTDTAQAWVKDSLAMLNLGHVNFTATPDRFALKIQFHAPLVPSPEKEKMLFRSWAYLIMQALRQKYKRPLKGLKIILMSNA